MRLRTTKLGIKIATGVLAAVQFFAPAMTVYPATNDSSTPTAPRVVAKNPVEETTVSENHVPAPKMDEGLKAQALKNNNVTAARIGEADGNKIDSFETFWRTDNGKLKGNRTLVWHDNGQQSLAYSMNYALSGKQPYEPGTIVIRVPKTIFSDRSGRPMGYMSFGVPQAPDRNACFAYTETDTEYVISNVKRLSAASSGYIEATIHGITPSEVKDLATGYKSKQLVPVIEVTTVKGTQLSAEAPALSANADTSGSIYGDYLKHDVSVVGKFPEGWDANIKPVDSDKYYYGMFTSYAASSATQYFNVKLSLDARRSDDARGAIILGVRNNRTGQVFKGNGTGKLDVTLEQNTYLSDGNNFMNTVYVAYPKDQFPTNRKYYLSLSNKYTMETVDDHTVTSTESLDTLPFTPVETEIPIGDFYVVKQGDGPDTEWYDGEHREGIYDTALNKICAGKKAEVNYWLQSRSHAGKYTLKDGGNPRNMNDYGKKSFEMITTDENLSLGDVKLDADDAEFKGLDFGAMLQGYVFTDLNDTNKVHNEITGSDFTADGETRPLFGYKRVANDRLPVVKVFTKHKGSNKYEEAGSIDYRSGKAVVRGINGNQAKDATLLFTPDTTGYKLQVAMALSGYAQDVNVLVTLKPSEKIKKIAKDLFKDARLPLAYLSNKTGLDVVVDKKTEHINGYTGRNRLMGFASGVDASKKLIDYKNDVRNSNVNLTYELTHTLQTNLLSVSGIKQAVKDGWMKEQTKGTFYDLLPKGMMPVTSSVRTVRDGDSIENIRVIENYHNTGRMMLIVKVHQTPDYRYHYNGSILGVRGYYDAPSIRYDARYNWLGLKTYGNLLSNVMAYDSDIDAGTVAGLQSEHDVNSGRNSSTQYALNDDDKKALSDLHGNLTFAKSEDRIHVDTSGLTNLVKQVDVNNESLFNDGLDEHVAKNVYANGRYTYMISVRTPDNTGAKNMIFYDSIENFKPVDENKDDATWRGKLESINLDSLTSAGVNPVVYYSTKKGLVLDNENNRADLDLNNSSIWSKTKPNAEDITAIAVDARKMTDGSPFILSSNNAVSFKLNMKAPKSVNDDMFDKVLEKGQKEAGMAGGAHAYNNAVLTSNPVSNTGSVGSGVLIHNDYTKVGLKPFKIGVEKTWNDDNDRDGLRRGDAEVELYANDKPTGKKVTLSGENHWKSNFGQVPYLDDRGVMIAYTVKEKDIKGYHMVIKDQKINDDGLTFKISNEHDPEKININGEKIWTDSSDVKRPESIGVILKADGKIIRQLDVRPVNGKWLYDFGQLFKYRDKGKEIRYELFEKDYVTGYVTKIEGFNVHNIYDPFTTVTIQKQVSNSTAASQKLNPDFTFRLNVTDLKKQIVNETYNYITSLGRSGKLSVGQDFTLKDKEVMTLSHVPSERVVNVTETKLPDGYKLDGIDGNNVTLQAGRPVTITAKNHYEAEGQIKVHMNKSLVGRGLKPYEFKFELLEDGKNNFVTAAATNDAKGGIDFYMPYSNKDSGTTRHYVVREVDGALGGVTYDKKTYPITVHISDDGKGKIIGTVEGDKQTFKNDYHAKGTVELKAWKVMSDHSKPKDEAYSFELLQDGKVIKSVANDKDGGISFPLDFTEKNVGKTYNYTVREVKGNDADVIYDTHTVDYSVTVFDRGNGLLDFKTVAKDNYTDDEHNDANSPVFYNKVKDGSLTISKAVQKGDPAETFKFRVKLKGQNVKNGNYHITRKKIWRCELIPTIDGLHYLKPSLENVPSDYTIVYYCNGKPVINPNFNPTSHSMFDLPPVNSNLVIRNNVMTTLKSAEDTDILKKDLHGFKFDLKDWKSARTDAVTGSEEHNSVCGTVKWSIDKNGTLLLEPVSGDCGDFGDSIKVINSSNGYNYDFIRNNSWGHYSTAPWLSYGGSIKKVQTRGTIIAPKDCGGLFYKCGIKELDMNGFDTSKTTMIDSMFAGCSGLTSLAPLEKWNVGNVTNMESTFQSCSGLTSLAPLEKWNVGNVTNMESTFQSCSGLTSLAGLEKWNVGNVTNMESTFKNCSKLMSLKALVDWDTKNIQSFGGDCDDRDGMFADCDNLTSLVGLEKWNTGNVTSMQYMFSDCSRLTSLVPLRKWNTENVKYMDGMFRYCYRLTSLAGLEKWNTGNVTSLCTFSNYGGGLGIFTGCSGLTSLKELVNWDTRNVRNFGVYDNYYGMFGDCSGLISIEFGNNFMTTKNPSMSGMFKECTNLSRVKLPKLPKESVQYIKELPTYEQKNRTDKWIREDKAYGPYTPQEMYDNWTPAMSGWWIREKIPVNYIVQFDFQGSGQSEKAYTATKDEDIVLPKITVQPVGKTFKGWSLIKNGDIITSLKNLAEVGQTVTLYAIWDSLPDNVDINNGEFTVDVPAGESVTIDGLTVGTDYEVEEFQKDGWVKVQEMNSIGKILSNKDQQAVFVNHYDSKKKQVSVNLQAKKLLDGKSAGGFEFELLENGKVIDKATSQFDGTISFTPINYSEAGHHEYQVREKVGNDKSITYDTTVRTIVVDVKDVDGKLQADVTKAPVFNNTTKTGSLDITKVIDNRNDVATSFNFVLTIGDKYQAFSLKAGEHKIINNLPIGTAYLLKEVNIPEGYSQVKIDNPAGAIKENETTKVIVTNTYHYSGFAQFKAHKVLDGGKLTSGQFTFRLSKDGQKIQDVQNDGNGDITFDAVEFNKPGTYHYTISEVGKVQGIKMDNHVIKADVTATAQNDGSLKVDVKYDGDTTFTNKVVPDEPTIVPEHKTRTNIKITKKVVGVNTRRTFRLNVNPSMLENGVKYEVTSDKSSKKMYLSKDKAFLNVRDGETLTIHNVLMPQEPDKYISERNYNGYTCNIDVNSEPTANGNELHYIVTNTYHVNDQFTLKGTKKLIGGNVNNYRFKFLILKDDDIVSTGYNDGENIYFKPIYYTEKDLGKTYTYTVIEDTGTNHSITYDTSAKTVKVAIGSSDNGKMSIRASGDVETLWTQGGKIVLGYSVTFTNKLIPNLPVTGTIVTACILAGLTITLSLVCLVKRKH